MAKTYSLDVSDIKVLLGGIPIEGFSPDSKITFTPTTTDYSNVVGVDGDFVRIKNGDKSAKVTLSLLQTSVSNTVLSTHRAVDVSTGRAVVPFIVKDTGEGGTLFLSSANCFIEGQPTIAVSKNVETWEWTIILPDASKSFFGGSKPL